jgi:hypothetical protein
MSDLLKNATLMSWVFRALTTALLIVAGVVWNDLRSSVKTLAADFQENSRLLNLKADAASARIGILEVFKATQEASIVTSEDHLKVWQNIYQIRQELAAMPSKFPPDDFRMQVTNMGTDMKALSTQLNAMNIQLATIATQLKIHMETKP